MGVAMVIAVEILGIRSLAFATGLYISIATTAAMFAGGLVRWAVEASMKEKAEGDSEASPGALYSSGLIAAGGIFGLLGIIIALLQDPEISNRVPHWMTAVLRLPWRPDLFAFGPKILGPPRHQQSFRTGHVSAPGWLIVLLCAQETGLRV